MKCICLSVFLFFAFTATHAQLKTTPRCPDIVVDILDGTVNTILVPASTVGQIKLNLPCYTSFEEEGTASSCGGNVFYKDRDIYFYTTRHYIEIGPKFKGKLSVPVMGAARNSLFKLLGTPEIKDVNWDSFKTAYGILILYYNASGKVNKIQFSNQSSGSIKLCE